MIKIKPILFSIVNVDIVGSIKDICRRKVDYNLYKNINDIRKSSGPELIFLVQFNVWKQVRHYDDFGRIL